MVIGDLYPSFFRSRRYGSDGSENGLLHEAVPFVLQHESVFHPIVLIAQACQQLIEYSSTETSTTVMAMMQKALQSIRQVILRREYLTSPDALAWGLNALSTMFVSGTVLLKPTLNNKIVHSTC